MASKASIKVEQNNLDGSQLLITDTGTYGTVSIRILTVYDFNNNVIGTYSMGALTQVVAIEADGYYSFILNVTDELGSYQALAVYVAQGYYTAQFLAIMATIDCDCNQNIFNRLLKGELYLASAQNYAMLGLAAASQQAITTANIWISNIN